MLNKKIKLVLIILFSSFTLFFVAENLDIDSAFARVRLDETFRPTSAPNVGIEGPAANDPSAYGAIILQLLAGSLIYIAAPVAVLILAIAGLLMVTQTTNEEYLERSKKTIKAVVIGLVIIIFSWVIVRSIINLLLEGEIADNPNINPQTVSEQEATPAPTTAPEPAPTPAT